MNFDAVLTLMVAISTYQTGICYPKDRTNANTLTQQNVIVTTRDVKWNEPKELFKPKHKSNIRKRRFTKENVGRVDVKILDAVKNPFRFSLSRLRRNEINPPNIVIPPKKLETCLRSLIQKHKIETNAKRATENDNWGYDNADYNDLNLDSEPSFEPIDTSGNSLQASWTIAPKKLDLLKALIKRFRSKTTTKFSKIMYNVVDHTVKNNTNLRHRQRLKSFLSLNVFDHIFTPSTTKYNETDDDTGIGGNERLSTYERFDSSSDLKNSYGSDYEYSFTTYEPLNSTSDLNTSSSSASEYSFTTNESLTSTSDLNTSPSSASGYSFTTNESLTSTSELNANVNTESESSFATTTEMTTEDYEYLQGNVESCDCDKGIVDTSLNSLAEKNITRFMTKLKNSHHDILPATPISLTLNEENDDILFSNNTLILPIPIVGKYMSKIVGKSKLSNMSISPSDESKTEHTNNSKLTDIKDTKGGLNDLEIPSLIPIIQQSPDLIGPYTNGSIFRHSSDVTEVQLSQEDQTETSSLLHTIQQGDSEKNSKVLIDYNSLSPNDTEQPMKLVPEKVHSTFIEPLPHLKDPNEKALHQDVEESSRAQPSFSSTMTVKHPNINIYSYNISSSNNKEIQRNLEGNKTFPENPLNRLQEIKRFLYGKDDILAIPFEVLPNEDIHLLPKYIDYLEHKGEKDQLFSGHGKMFQESYIHGKRGSCNHCNAKQPTVHATNHTTNHTTKHRVHHKVHPTRFGMHVQNNHYVSCSVVTCSKCPKCATQTEETSGKTVETGDTYPFFQCAWETTEAPVTVQTSTSDERCTCRKTSKETEFVDLKTEKRMQIDHELTNPVSISTVKEKTTSITDDDEPEEDYQTYTSKYDLDKQIECSTFENFEKLECITHRPVEAQCRADFLTTCSCQPKKATVTGRSRQDIIVAYFCGAASCTICTKSTTDPDYENVLPKNSKTDFCIDSSETETVCVPVEWTSLSEVEGPTICTNVPLLPEPIVYTNPPVPWPNNVKTKKRRCTCACFCGTKSQYCGKKHTASTTNNYETTKKDVLDIFHHSNQTSSIFTLNGVESTSDLNKKTSYNFQKLFLPSHNEDSTIDYSQLETYYTVTDINLTDFLSNTTVHEIHYETEDSDKVNADYWTSDSNLDTDLSSPNKSQSYESYAGFECQLPSSTEQIRETICFEVTTAFFGRRCSCSRNKVRKKKIGNQQKNKKEKNEKNNRPIKSKYVAKYKTYELDSSEITNGWNHETHILENINPEYKEVTRFNQLTEATRQTYEEIETVTLGYEDMDLYPTQITTQDYEVFNIDPTATTPHSLLSPKEKKTLSTKKKKIHRHDKLRAVLSSNNLRRSHIRNSVLNTLKKARSTTFEPRFPIIFPEKVDEKCHLVNHEDKDLAHPIDKRPTNVIRLITEKDEHKALKDSDLISLPKVITKNGEIASVKIFFGQDSMEHNKKSKRKRKRFNSANKFFTFETKL